MEETEATARTLEGKVGARKYWALEELNKIKGGYEEERGIRAGQRVGRDGLKEKELRAL